MARDGFIAYGVTSAGETAPFHVSGGGRLASGGVTTNVTAADRAYPPAATDATVTYAAVADKAHVVDGVGWSYNGVPTAGRLTVENGAGTVVRDYDITAAGPGYLPVSVQGTPNTAMIVKLYSGGGSVVGKLNVYGKGTA